MKIAVNTRLLLTGKLEGIGWFSHETLRRLVEKHPDWEFHFLFDRKPHASFIYAPNVTAHVIGPQARHPFLYYIWFHHSIKRALKKIKPQLFLSPDGFNCPKAPCPTLPIIHDLNFETHPEILPPVTSSYYRRFFQKYAQSAARIGTVSNFSKQDIINKYQISESKIDILYNGVNPLFSKIPEARKKQVRASYSKGKNYALYVGALNPRKNVSRLLQAFDQYINDSGSDLQLLIVGEKMHWTADMEKTYLGLQNARQIIFTGRLSNNELSLVVGAARFLMYPSLFEGFGVPIIEAMKCKVPVLTSNTSCMPEISGKAALLVDPFSIDSIRTGIEQLDTDENLRNKLIELGTENAKKYSWERTTQLLEQSILKAVQNHD